MASHRAAQEAGADVAVRKATVLVVDDDSSMRDTVQAILRGHRLRVLQAATGDAALDTIRRYKVDVVFLDINLGGEGALDGMQVLEHIRARYDDIEVIMCTVDREVRSAVRAIKAGAFDYLTKDFADLSSAAELIERALERQRARREILYLRDEVSRVDDAGFVLGKNPLMKNLIEVATRIASLPATVLILGESGTGKEMLARLIHRQSDRAERPFVTINLAAVPREMVESTLFGHEKGAFTGAVCQHLGKFELADGGTLFLDEIGDMSLDMQSKLLRAIQEREIERVGGDAAIAVDVRLIAATNIDLDAAVRAGLFREDLYYRLNVIPLKLPPLRERRDDIPELARFFGRKYAARFRRAAPDFTEQALAVLLAHDWPGNIRELENLIERLLATTAKSVLDEDDIPIEYHFQRIAGLRRRAGADLLSMACETFERAFLYRALEKTGWNRAETARQLGVPYNTLKYKIAKHALREPAPARSETVRGGGTRKA